MASTATVSSKYTVIPEGVEVVRIDERFKSQTPVIVYSKNVFSGSKSSTDPSQKKEKVIKEKVPKEKSGENPPRKMNKVPRIVTIAFRKDGNKVTYGASVFKAETMVTPNTKKTEKFDIQAHNRTAIDRLRKSGVTITLNASSNEEFVIKLRKALFKHGVRSKEKSHNSLTDSVSSISSDTPNEEPSVSPSETPSEEPSVSPSETPSEEPFVSPSESPSEEPSETQSNTSS